MVCHWYGHSALHAKQNNTVCAFVHFSYSMNVEDLSNIHVDLFLSVDDS